MTIAGTAVTEVTIEADLSYAQSDERNRDGQLGRAGIETDQSRPATFTITSPIELGSIPPMARRSRSPRAVSSRSTARRRTSRCP